MRGSCARTEGKAPSPTDPLVDAGNAARVADADEVDERLPVGQAPGNVAEFRRRVADNDGIGVVDNLVDACNHQARDMGDAVEDVVAVRPVDGCEADVAVVHAQVVALSDQPLDQFHYRALAQVIGTRLEAEAEY